ncbi:Krueppel homolog 2 [Nasonia vitripennis]|uniref:Krueppel homolog 2 n=1 Tax=Nasonia vitripennis TaxID=7425 RepID=A0A7M7G176_NASVI|nr:Krueppel homolog 2 [Nasonia vitripennis]XP_003424837.1 Krueppel homolog 2 [Nasonia vitripennis]XP_032458190.1 Krueppel homolog 2 [Nasonia vitripennis]
MADTATSGTESTSTPIEKGWPALKQQIIQDKIKVAQWAIRLVTILFTFAYLLPIFGSPYDAYYKVLLSCTATNILRLHQRLPRISFTREFLTTLFLEDSFHYLFYTSIFQYTSPVTLVIVPVFLFALLHSASYSLTLLDCLGQNSWWGARLLISIVEFQSRNILKLCALCEILVMPLTVLLIFTGRAGLLTPIVYYQFLQLRLASRRNPFTRNVFIEITNTFSTIAMKPSVPEILRRIIGSLVELMRRLTPVHQ